MTDTYHRRAVIGTVGTAVAALAGCSAPEDGATETQTDTAADAAETEHTDIAEGDGDGDERTATTIGDDLDLREANVVDVAVEARDGDQYQLGGTLYHDDDGEDGYANWWQVETLDGERLGRRDLTHAHSTDPFTRSETIEIPEDGNCVVIRATTRPTSTAAKRC